MCIACSRSKHSTQMSKRGSAGREQVPAAATVNLYIISVCFLYFEDNASCCDCEPKWEIEGFSIRKETLLIFLLMTSFEINLFNFMRIL